MIVAFFIRYNEYVLGFSFVCYVDRGVGEEKTDWSYLDETTDDIGLNKGFEKVV